MAITPITNQAASSSVQETRNDKKTQTDNTAQQKKMYDVNDRDNVTLSKKALESARTSMDLLNKMKEHFQWGKSTGDQVGDLVNAYDELHKELNPNSENSNKHGKVLDEAFKDIAKLLFKQSVKAQQTQEPKDTQEWLTEYRQQQADAEKKAISFANQFLKDYKKWGIAAYKGY